MTSEQQNAVHLTYEPSSRKNKRLSVTISSNNGFSKRVHFGQPGAFTFFDGADEAKRNNYVKRHSVREDWSDPLTAGFHSRFVLWSFREKQRKKIEKEIKANSIVPIKSITWINV